jgi:hypothetical protein
MEQPLQKVNSTYVYDIETLTNFFSAVFLDIQTKEIYIFKIYSTDTSELNQLDELISFLQKCKGLIGFNNLAFDFQVLESIIQNYTKLKHKSTKDIVSDIYSYAQEHIEREIPKIHPNKFSIPNLDLFKLNHFDGKAKQGVSLKWLQYVLDYDNVQDMPIHHTSRVKDEDIDLIIEYNINDVKSTYHFYELCHDKLDLRRTLSKLYNINLMNASEPRIVKETMLIDMSKSMGIDKDVLKEMRTKRDKICFDEIIFDYVKFESKEFNALLEFLKLQCITETKGAFSKITNKTKGFELIRKYIPNDSEFIKLDKKGITVKKLAIKFDNEIYVYGTGGIHSYLKNRLVIPKDDELILDLDVESYYPNLCIKNKLRPEHLGEHFTELYENYFLMRKKYPKKTAMNTFYKLILNTLYGLSNEENSFLYDPKMTMSITLNGQLLLSMLIERLVLHTNSKCVAANTDGATFVIKKDELELVKSIVLEWENLTKLKMEEAYYDKLIFRDVNSYIWLGKSKPKLKGFFEYKPEIIEYHKKHSMPIVPEAIVKYFTEGTDVIDFIRNCKDVFKFKIGVKAKGNNKYEYRVYDKNLNLIKRDPGKVVRYYVSTKGGQLMRIMPPIVKADKDPNQLRMFDDVELKNRESNQEAGYKVKIFNKYNSNEKLFINYNYYIKQALSIIKKFDMDYYKKCISRLKSEQQKL